MKQEKTTWHGIYMWLVGFLVIIQFLPYLDYLGILPQFVAKSKMIIALNNGWYLMLYKIFYIVMIPVLTSLLFSIKQVTKPGEKQMYKLIYFIFSAIVIIGAIKSPSFYYYNIIFLPILLITHLFISSRAWAKDVQPLIDENVLGISSKPLGVLGLKYTVIDPKTKKELPLHIHNVFQSILVMGGAGAGKSASLIEPAICQWVEQGASMSIYDFKGNPATLGLTAYSAWKHYGKKWDSSKGLFPSFELISFVELKKTSRPNPISPKVLKNSIDSQSITKILMTALAPKKNPDFWDKSAYSLAHGICERLRKGYPEYCTIPHLICIGLMKPSDIIAWLGKDFEVRSIVMSFISAEGAESQLAGMLSSFQTPLTPLMASEIFWVLGAPLEDQIEMDLNNKENPRILSIANNPDQDAALSPLISCIFANIMQKINVAGRHPHAMILDEYPTIYLDISKLPATGRSNKICVMPGIQDMAQLEEAYNKELAAKTIANLGTQFYGMSNNKTTSENVSNLIGTQKKQDDSYSLSDDGVNLSKRLNNEKVIQARDVASQPVGHFTGKIADGNPAFFSCQFKEFKASNLFDMQKEIGELKYSPMLMDIHKQNPEMAEEIFNTMVEANKQRIILESIKIITGEIIDQNDIE